MNHFIRKVLKKISNLRLIDQRQLYKYWEQQHLKRLIQECQIDCVFDVGANNGQYGSMLRRAVGYNGLIVSFEPNPTAASLAREMAKGDPKWFIEELALSVADGEQKFNLMADSEFSSLSKPKHDETRLFEDWNSVKSSITVKTETLSTAYQRMRNLYQFTKPFLKMDTQGYDVEIISNAGPALNNFVALQSELSVKKLYSNAIDFRDAISLYQSLGFELSAFVPNNSGHFPHLIETDCIMIRKEFKGSNH